MEWSKGMNKLIKYQSFVCFSFKIENIEDEIKNIFFNSWKRDNEKVLFARLAEVAEGVHA